MKDFFDAVLEDDGLRNPLPQHHRNRKPGKTTITTGVWSGINDTDLTRFYNGRKKIPAWKAAEFYQRLDISKVERLCDEHHIRLKHVDHRREDCAVRIRMFSYRWR